ncbi:oligosaccharide flippase family protein [Radiobacillus kanasensis]|uniref:lipopolysaccharide biosynthesis protein n=1 Tax=Radiobacillus kanasensis TaxID=2844358 RepID=UPI001E603E13|nr:oligosaccharide flippase family protein [Radiobacillus kanasensis]UFT98891.1 oligosaccharide flippase family protein [Radiobacillus kanasensis]
MFKRLFKSAGIYVFSSILNAAVPFLLIPIFTRNMSTSEYGLFSMFQMVLLVFGPIVGLSIHGAITRQYYEKDSIDFPTYVTTSLTILLLSGGITSVLIALFHNTIYFLTDLQWVWVQLSILVCLSQFIFQVVLVLFQVQLKAVKFGIFLITQSILNGGLSIILVVFFDLGWHGAVIGLSTSYITYGIIGLFIIGNGGFIKRKVSRDYFIHALKFGVPLIPVSLGMALMNMSDRIFIKNMVGLEAVGIYTVGYQISMILMIIITAFNKAWVPWLFDKLKLDQIREKAKIVKFTYYYFIIVFVGAVILGICSPFIISFYVSPEFISASIFVFWISLGYAFNGMYKMMTNYVHFAQKTHLNFNVMLIAVPINLILNYFLIKFNGPIGASQSTAISFLVAFLSMWVLSSKVYYMPWFTFAKAEKFAPKTNKTIKEK